jgi:hypothetical protein
VFVSYSRQDVSHVDPLVEQIERLGFGVWIDRDSSGSQRYAAQIVRAIRTSKMVALMCSQHAFASDHVIREVYVAGDFKKPFLAFMLDVTEFPDELLYFVSGYPRVSVTNIDQHKLRSAIAGLLGAKNKAL